MKVIISNNAIVPYRTHFLNMFFSKYKGEFEKLLVLYLTHSESIRNWSYNSEAEFDSVVLDNFYQARNKKTTTSDLILNRNFIKYLKSADIFLSLGYSYPTYLVMAFFSKIKGIKTACFCETNISDSKRSILKSKFKKILLNSLYDRFFVPGINAEDYLLDLGISKNKIVRIGNSAPFSISQDEINYISDDNVNRSTLNLLYVGRLSEEKNIVNALKWIEFFEPSINITIVGSGPLLTSVEELASYSKHNYKLIDNIEREKLPYIYKCNDVLLLPSLSETWGLVANEAVSCGMALFLSDHVGCAPELIKNNGEVFELLNKSDFLRKLGLIYENIENYKEASKLLQYDISAEKNATLLYDALRDLYEDN
ncbi:glycosyltransferase [Photobacterium leiognathi]|uniref:glycosyltransferase n=1 Tax=Photobacterium leiognathi TaxID=553611 RepID=UPI002982B0FA|nr:glycosyltransferase [Photobacterium leiognathi]